MPEQDIKNLDNFRMYWSAAISPFVTSLIGRSWTQDTFEIHGENLKNILLFSDGTKSTCYLDWDEREIFAEKMIEKYGDSVVHVQMICDLVGDGGLALIQRAREIEKNPTKESYIELRDKSLVYNAHYVVPRHLADFMDTAEFAPYLEMLRSARMKVETLHTELGDVFATIISSLAGVTEQQASQYTIDQVDDFLAGEKLPEVEYTEMADFGSLVKPTTTNQFSGAESHNMYDELTSVESDITEIIGMVAFGGITTGKVKIVLDPAKVTDFADGDILVAEMTRPEYVPLMNKAAAIVTDGGGLLCHAAIVARELKKPCIIGTKIATKVLKDGDLVEIDADKGIIRKKA